MTQESKYAEAIDVLVKLHDPRDAKAIVVYLAKYHPEVLVEAHENTSPNPHALIDTILHHSTDKVAAIKKHRGITGFGLKESKDMIEARMAETNFTFD